MITPKKRSFSKSGWVKSNKGTFYRHKIGNCAPQLRCTRQEASQNVLLALRQLLWGGTDVKWDIPISLGWVAEAERRKAVSQAKQPQGSLAAAEGLRSQLVVSVQEAQLRSAGGIEGRYGMNPVPGGWLPATVGNSNRRFFSREHSSSTWTNSQGLGHVGKARTQLQRSASHKQVETTCCYHHPKHPRGLLHSNVM